MNCLTNGTTVFLAVLPRLERQARFACRSMTDVHRLEDCVQEILALCSLWTFRLSPGWISQMRRDVHKDGHAFGRSCLTAPL